IKTRIAVRDVPYTWQDESVNFLNKMQPIRPEKLNPVIWINYNRHTLVNRNGAERLTLDLNLQFIRGEQELQLNGLVIAEVKQDGKKASPFLALMKKKHIREGSISKYCMGIA